jgi:hypothetical protein
VHSVLVEGGLEIVYILKAPNDDAYVNTIRRAINGNSDENINSLRFLGLFNVRTPGATNASNIYLRVCFVRLLDEGEDTDESRFLRAFFSFVG